jgi:hypothetical protein
MSAQPLPDLTAWATPHDKAALLLETTAEAEHALLVGYLYAAYTLKGAEDAADEQASALSSWSPTLTRMAIAQMQRLMTVQNLLLAIGRAPDVAQGDAAPPPAGLRPLARHVEPLTQRSLAKYIAAEGPAAAADIGAIVALAAQAAGEPVNRVGRLYELLAVVFSTEAQLSAAPPPDDAWEQRLREVASEAHAQAPAPAWHLPDGAIDAQTVDHQASSNWGHVLQATDRAEALEAIRDLGESRVVISGDGASQFERLLRIYTGGDGENLPFPAPGGSWVPARAVPTDGRPQDIAEPRTRGWSQLADLRYALLLGAMEHHLRTANEDDRSTLSNWAFSEMRALENASPTLVTLPRGTGVGAPPFTLPAPDHLPDSEIERWRVHEARTRSAITMITRLQAAGPGPGDDLLVQLLEADRARLEAITARIAALP